jgi:hypothetical protein
MEMVEILQNKELCDLFERVTSWPGAFLGKYSTLELSRFRDIHMSHYLTLPAHDRYLLAKYALPFDSLDFFYCSEADGRLEQDIANVSLSTVPIEPLIRYLGPKPVFFIKDWLAQQIETSEGVKTRLETISPEQTKAILTRSTTYEGDMPLPELRELFHVSEQEASTWCVREECNPPLDDQDNTESAQCPEENMDPNDSLSLVLPIEQKSITSALDYIAGLLIEAKETTLCGQRLFLAYGSAEADPFACVSQDDPPLQCQYQGKPFTPNPRGLFNDIGFDVPEVAIRRKLLDLKKTYSKWLSFFNNQSLEGLSIKQREMVFELLRIVENLYTRFPQLRRSIS